MRDKISVLVPCRNEALYIQRFVESLLDQTIPVEQLEILIIDGMSSDATREILQEIAEKHAYLRMLDNPNQTVPYALNIGLAHSTGSTIVRMDVHSVYPRDYIESLLFWQEELKADNVGGVWLITPANETLQAVAVAQASSHFFGAGNADYKIGADKPTEVDTVPFGCYRRGVFERIGLFDEDLTRNQDDEINGRLRKSGGRIYLVPQIKIKYFARPTIQKLASMHYQYGLFKPLVLRKLGSPATLRQFVPSALILALLFTLFCSLFFPAIIVLFSAIALVYSAVALLCALTIAVSNNAQWSIVRKLRLVLLVFIAFLAIHFSYGYGYLQGVWKFLIRRHSGNTLVRMLPSR